jgi:hypothetical protein
MQTGNAGIDNPFIRGVGRAEFPPSVEDCIQEKGRTGRYPGAVHDGCWYAVCLSLPSFCSLRRRMERSFPGANKPSFYYRLQKLLDNVALILVVPQTCIHRAFAIISANPYAAGLPFTTDCGDRCSFCRGQYKVIFPPIVRAGVVQVLMDVFLHRRQQNPVLTIDDTLITAIREYKNTNGIDSKKLILNSSARGNMRPIDIKKFIFILLAAGILGMSPKEAEADANGEVNIDLHATLVQDSQQHPFLFDDTKWALISTK